VEVAMLEAEQVVVLMVVSDRLPCNYYIAVPKKIPVTYKAVNVSHLYEQCFLSVFLVE
jgi:hypothetical protein